MHVQSPQLATSDNRFNVTYICGGCNYRIIATVVMFADYSVVEATQERGKIFWCICACGQPTVVVREENPGSKMIQQHPTAVEFHPESQWPMEAQRLYAEAAAAFSAQAFTATAMVCRKLLMLVACLKGDQDGKSFAEYVDFILSKVVPIPSAKQAIDAIRTIGNEANHNVSFVQEPEARRSLSIAKYVLNAVYSLPTA